ncbi:uncharacterized protein LOC112568897 isoform X1 [Pomacea canaliculata]|uniref:uncharacterized protein LOC112568897 isoform X1 n=2 Tax=Pomacea canaliculata TaxID=400727 RepID=UPI000D73E50A|nr:uncharacterized protein LOC112568897 isoform X1 [Pomacea canaliculata]XP_025102220.1 uncharacterized protein LOC112568897 isoform X1 [Pomacea canaliculata]XP_025102221.1 uncharacterized protein LOC112568897 isoform X1 [Pomacea canaliculata]XP_025102222.1 uncharacterized protein LOC112568897 isoform X1 [Pomacea canaliculata]XP_025102223.1 uncharacterized protein LOC112568897 isoform X1 [Pomacea canaliculata]
MMGGLMERCLFLAILRLAQAVNLQQCGSDKPLVVEENTTNYNIICENIRSGFSVAWTVNRTFPDRSVISTGQCRDGNTACTSSFSLMTYSRPNSSFSIATITEVKRLSFGMTSITCMDYVETSNSISSNNNCNLEIIYKADVSSCNIQAVPSESVWNLRGLCSITKVFSTFNRYACHLWQNQSSSSGKEVASVTYSPTLDTNSPPYAHGSCSYSLPLPIDSDIYSFTVAVSPGGTTMSAGTITVERPLQPPIINCTMSTFPYVREQGDLTCTCTALDIGTPGGRLIGYYGGQRLNTSNFGDKYLNFGKRSLSRADDATPVKCILDWATQDTDDRSTNFTLRIAYGPDVVTITGPSVFDINPSQVQNISLSCRESVVSPFVNYSWTGCPSGDSMSRVCSFLPSPSDTNYFVQCTVSNPLSQVTRTANYSVELNYPPSDPPVISLEPPLNLGEPVYQGDNFTATCTVHGGKPVSATNVSFACPHMADTTDITGTAEVKSTLRFYSVSPDYQGNCTCSAMWRNTTWYTQTAVWSLTVYTPPFSPIIFPLLGYISGSTYPFMAGTSGTLSCQSNQSGRPEATYSWPVAAGGHPSGSNLTFYNMSREDNGQTVKCRASNSYTENRQPVDDATFVLQVYYKPLISFTHISGGITCGESSSVHTYCVVAEGQRLHINCTADSNPAPASFKWLSPNTDVYSDTSALVIMSTNHTIHNGDYNCTVITEQVDKDSRLPLMSSAILAVVAGYSPRVLTFSINNVDSMVVNIPEKSRVDMKCLCSGRPIPSIRLVNTADPEQFLNQSLPTGDIFVDEQTREVLFTMQQVSCEASGFYRCDVNNSLGEDRQSRMLAVSCAPRKSFSDGQPLTIGVTNGRGELRVQLTAYPTPVMKVLTYLGPNETPDGHPLKENIIIVECFSKFLAPAEVICSISLVNVTHNEEGFYRIVFSNSLGELSFTFFVTQAASEDVHQTKADQNIAAVAVLAVLFSVLLIVVVVFVIWVWRRGWTLPCADVSNQRISQQDQRGDTSSENLLSVTTNTSLMKEGGQTSLYESLQMEDVGKRSHYEEVQRYQNASTTAPYEVVNDNKREVRGDHTYVN